MLVSEGLPSGEASESNETMTKKKKERNKKAFIEIWLVLKSKGCQLGCLVNCSFENMFIFFIIELNFLL